MYHFTKGRNSTFDYRAIGRSVVQDSFVVPIFIMGTFGVSGLLRMTVKEDRLMCPSQTLPVIRPQILPGKLVADTGDVEDMAGTGRFCFYLVS